MASPFVGLLVTAYLSRVDCSGSTVPRCCYKASRYAEDPYQGSSSIPASVRPPIHRPRSGRWRTASRTTNRSGLCSVPKAVSEARRASRLRVLPARGYEYRDFRFHRRTMGGWRVLAGVTVPAPPSTRWQAKTSRGCERRISRWRSCPTVAIALTRLRRWCGRLRCRAGACATRRAGSRRRRGRVRARFGDRRPTSAARRSGCRRGGPRR
jgi:hypothetical protein